MGEDWMRVASVGDVKPGEVVQVFAGDEPVALANVDGEFLATSNICSHEYAELHEGWLEGEEIECPLHGSRFDLRTGKVLSLPATRPVPVYEVKVEGDAVFVRGPVERKE